MAGVWGRSMIELFSFYVDSRDIVFCGIISMIPYGSLIMLVSGGVLFCSLS